MKCENCHNETKKISYFQTKVVCSRCFERLSFHSKCIRLKEMRDGKLQNNQENTSQHT